MKETVHYEVAGNVARVMAALIDILILTGMTMMLSLVFRDAAQVLGGLLCMGYEWYFWVYKNGQTPGKAAMNIRIIMVDGTSLGTQDVLTRWMGYGICALPLGLGFLWALWDPYHQGWHDKLAETVVVKA
jgi:uncharacterized RDD family membrane protein YckC